MRNILINIYILISAITIGILCYVQYTRTKKIGFVTTLKVFEEFALKKELEGDYKKLQIIKQTYLDSIKLNIQSLAVTSKQPDKDEKIADYKKVYLLKENQFNQENEALYQQYNEQIWKQLNQFIEDFGKENGYDYLLGASGQGSIMYANEKEDLTKQIIDYVNTKYSGKKTK